MKNLFMFPLLVLVLFSCISEETPDAMHNEEAAAALKDMKQAQKWQLVRTTGQLPNSETTGASMPWQEYYVLNPDGTFTKTRQTGEASTTASGIYTYHESSQEKYLELTYPTQNELIGNCTSDLKEILLLRDNRLFSSWQACDGPGLEYRKVD